MDADPQEQYIEQACPQEFPFPTKSRNNNLTISKHTVPLNSCKHTTKL